MQRYPSGAQKYAAQICRLWSQFTRGEELVELGPPEKGRHRGEKELAARGLGDSVTRGGADLQHWWWP